MFDKQEYWKRRKAGLRGQETAKPRFYAKGAKVTLPDKTVEGVLITGRKLPNGEGKLYSRTKSGLVAINRKQARQRIIDRDYTKPNIGYRSKREVMPFKGHRRNTSKNQPLQLPVYPSSESNHDRMLARAVA